MKNQIIQKSRNRSRANPNHHKADPWKVPVVTNLHRGKTDHLTSFHFPDIKAYIYAENYEKANNMYQRIIQNYENKKSS